MRSRSKGPPSHEGRFSISSSTMPTDADQRMAAAMAGVDLKPLKGARERRDLGRPPSGSKRWAATERGLTGAPAGGFLAFAAKLDRRHASPSIAASMRSGAAVGDTSGRFQFLYQARGLPRGRVHLDDAAWFADSSEGAADTWAFLDKRIEKRDADRKVQGDRAQIRRRPTPTHSLDPGFAASPRAS